MKKDKSKKVIVGVVLIALGVLWLGCNLLSFMANWLDIPWRFGFWNLVGGLWPLIVVGAGVALCIPPITQPQRRDLGGMWIPGVAVLTTGLILTLSGFTGYWDIWARLWPLELVGLAVGFILAFVFTRNSGLLVPAVIIGMNGIIFLFCSLTGLWGAWAVLWTLEPFAVGLALFTLYVFGDKSSGLLQASVILSGISGVMFLVALLFLAGWVGKILGGFLFIIIGAAVLLWSAMRAPKDEADSASVEELERLRKEDNYGATGG